MAVLRVLAHDDGEHYGLELAKKAHIRRSSVYRIVGRLVEIGWLRAEEEDIDERREGRRKRTRLTVTPLGVKAIPAELAAWEAENAARGQRSWDSGPSGVTWW